MARDKNFLLGQGERLASRAEVHTGGGPKNPPYEFSQARRRISEKLGATSAELQLTPNDACPDGEVVAVITLHPRYLSKSDYPSELLSAAGLRAVGSRARVVSPESWGTQKHPEAAVTDDIFVAGTKATFSRWATQLPHWAQSDPGARQLLKVEDIAPFREADKLRSIPADGHEVLLEVVIHNAGLASVVDRFGEYANDHGAKPIMKRRRDIRGLTFVPVRVPANKVDEIARFAFVRVARGMPTLRPLEPGLTRAAVSPLILPDDGPLDPSIRVAIFDGGIPSGARTAIAPWVALHDSPRIGPPHPDAETHGLAVTSALLFGPLEPGGPVPQPLCHVDHYRVLDSQSGHNDMEILDVLDRIVDVLDATKGQHRFISLSLGPNLACADDEVTAWTALLDSRLVGGGAIACVAAGNDGELDQGAGLHRVQPPADGVNVLAVGACDSRSDPWQRAGYSSMGPGRSPGLVKPDGVAFGGCSAEPFVVASPALSEAQTYGTSFAAPYALRASVSVAAQLGAALNPLAIRALMIHRANPGAHDRVEVGWGRFEVDPLRLITSDDDEALIVYQGELPISEYLRAPMPVPDSPLQGFVTLGATLVIAPEVDPEYPDAYTRGGLQVAFRPHAKRYTEYPDGKRSHHPKTRSFFSATNMYGAAEYEFREDGLKWEPCLRNSQRFQASSLHEPCFDIYFHHRESGAQAPEPRPIPYALVLSIQAPRVTDLYNQIVRAYANILLPITPQLQIRVST